VACKPGDDQALVQQARKSASEACKVGHNCPEWTSVVVKVGIIGGGPAGLTAGYLLSKAGVHVDVFEADPKYVGGISRTVFYKGFRFDIGGHRFFSKSSEVEALWNEILPDDMITRDRLSRIYYKNKFYSYPLEAAEVVENLGKRESLLSVGSYLKAKIIPTPEPQNLEDWVTRKFGSRLYRTFFKSYTEKVWGRPCSEISADWAAQRIKGLSLTTAAINSLRSRVSTPPSGDRSKQIKTLIKSFRYPRLGPGMMWEAAADHIRSRGGQVMLGSKVRTLHHDADAGTWNLVLDDEGTSHGPYQHVISSAPLPAMIAAIDKPLPADALEAAASLGYRDFLQVALILRPGQTFPDQWIYIHDPALQVGRIQNFQNWSPELVDGSGKMCYGMEYFCFQGDSLWSLSDQELIKLATEELIALGLAKPGDVVDGCVVKQPKAYPVYDDQYQERIAIIKNALADHCPGLHQVGRNGMHRYNNQDHSMMTAMLTARNILDPSLNFDAWAVNQDAEYHEAGPEKKLDQQVES
jgi:protoporphyrinogen oxidase